METDHKYEFDCPQFVDFDSVTNEEGADEWFEVRRSQMEDDGVTKSNYKRNDGCWSPIAKPNYARPCVKPRFGITIPITPKLQAKNRCRPVTALSRKDLEDRVVSEMKKYQFRAQPILKAAATVKDNNLKSADVKTKPAATESKPAIDMKSSAKKRKINIPYEPNKRVSRLPYEGMPNVRDEAGHVVVKPFAFDENETMRKEKKEAKIREVLEKEKALRQFKALPVPSFAANLAVAKSSKPPTTTEPFELESLQRHESYKEKWHQKMKEEEMTAKKNALFVARPCTVTSTSPFQPGRSFKKLTEPFVDLHSERRAEERRQFDERLKAKEKERLDLERQREEWRRQEEEVAIAQLRATLVHKPLPLPSFASPRVVESKTELTLPKSPALGLKRNRLL